MRKLLEISTFLGLVALSVALLVTVSNTNPVAVEAANNQPGLSYPWCESNGVSMYWHTKNGGNAEAPDGWTVERRNRTESQWSGEGDGEGDWVEGDWDTKSWSFIGSDADALQTFSDDYWDWVDTSASEDVTYTYRVRAVDSNGSPATNREWSSRMRSRC